MRYAVLLALFIAVTVAAFGQSNVPAGPNPDGTTKATTPWTPDKPAGPNPDDSGALPPADPPPPGGDQSAAIAELQRQLNYAQAQLLAKEAQLNEARAHKATPPSAAPRRYHPWTSNGPSVAVLQREIRTLRSQISSLQSQLNRIQSQRKYKANWPTKEKPMTTTAILGLAALIVLGIIILGCLAVGIVGILTRGRTDECAARERERQDGEVRRIQAQTQGNQGTIDAINRLATTLPDGRRAVFSGTPTSFAGRVEPANATPMATEPRREPVQQRDPLDQRIDEMRKIRALTEELAPKPAPKAEAAPKPADGPAKYSVEDLRGLADVLRPAAAQAAPGTRAMQTDDGDYLIPVSAAEKLMQAAKPAGAPKQQQTRRTGGTT